MHHLRYCSHLGPPAAKAISIHSANEWTMSRRQDSSLLKELGANVALESHLAMLGPDVVLCLNVRFIRIAVAVEHAQGFRERPRSRTVECMLRWEPSRVRGRRKGHGS